MSSRSFSHFKRLSATSAFILGIAVHGAFAASSAPVQTYVDQAAPAAPDGYYDSPLSAGTLTLKDVLEAHPKVKRTPDLPPPGTVPPVTATAPILTPSQSSSTASMISQGMKDVLQKVGTTPAPTASAASTTALPTPLVPSAAPQIVDGIQYQPGQAPRSLGGEVAAPAAAPSAPASSPLPDTTTVGSPAAPAATETASGTGTPDQSCDQHVKRWDKTCADAGYPTTFVGKIVGETRTGCSDGALHDVWVTNTCAPPDYSAQATKVNGNCGPASNNEFDDSPSSNLCSQGIPSAVSGDGPWTWACSGINGGDASACSAHKRGAASNGICGSSNGITSASAPVENLCDGGTPTKVDGSGPWTWTCKGIGSGISQSCISLAIPKEQAAAAAQPEAEETTPAPNVAAVPTPSPVPAPASAAPDATASADNNLCGEAAETLAYTAPDKDLCRVGTASAVNGDGPWSWSCTTNEGTTSSCKTLSLNGDAAPAAVPAPAPEPSPVASVLQTSPTPKAAAPTAVPSAAAVPAEPVKELACGSAASQAVSEAPSTDLCEGGKASKVHGTNPWHWTCHKGHNTISCETPKIVEGSCGPANGATLKSAPFAGLCSVGTPTSIEGTGPWTWTCNGKGGGVNVSCAAGVQAKEEKVDGVCGNANGTSVSIAPASDLCASGTASGVSGDGPWSWACSGSNGGAVGSCSANKIVPPKPPGLAVSGQCGAANGTMVSSQPADDLCAAGEVSGPVGNGPWNWSCIGLNGGMTVSCTAPLQPPAPIDGVCGDANGVATLVKPESALCSSGILGTVNGNGPWTWTCSGANGGNPAACVAPMAGRVGSMPSTMQPASTMAITEGSDNPTGGLVTPRLPSPDKISSLDRKVLPSLTPSKTLQTPPVASPTPEPVAMAADTVASSAPDLPAGMEPVQPPAIGSALPSAPVLQEEAESPHISGNHLTLDPTISTVLFTPGSENIDDQVLPTLNKLAIVLQSNPDARISLLAYADNTGSTPRDARRLSLKRALAIKNFLASKDISESRVDVHAEGANTTSGYLDRVDVKVND